MHFYQFSKSDDSNTYHITINAIHVCIQFKWKSRVLDQGSLKIFNFDLKVQPVKNVKFCHLGKPLTYQMALKWMKVQHQQDLFAANSTLIRPPLRELIE